VADSKPYASLSSGLLARKGGAKPAMRPQGFNSFGAAGLGASLEDLGWNDMGPDDEYTHHHAPGSIGLTPAGRSHAAPEPVHDEDFEERSETPVSIAPIAVAPVPIAPAPAPAPVAQAPAEPPPVVEQQRALRESFAPRSVADATPDAEVVELPRRRAAPVGVKAKAAFTLRLDPERHLKLRLASAVTRLSAQQLVTGALDDFLNSLPELDALAERVPAEAGQRNR
jgi:hypothetical protein